MVLNKKLLSIFVLMAFVLVASPVIAETFPQGKQLEIKHTVTGNGSIGAVNEVNITIQYPNSSILAGFDSMTLDSDSQKWTYTINGTHTQDLGVYPYTIYAFTDFGDKATSFSFEVTSSGREFTSGQGFASLGIMGGILMLAFFFLTIGFKFNEWNNKPLALFFGVMAIFMAIYSLQLGLNFSVDILDYPSLTNLQSTIYVATLWLITFVVLVSFILMVFSFVKEFGKGKMMKNFGEGFDPISQTYQ